VRRLHEEPAISQIRRISAILISLVATLSGAAAGEPVDWEARHTDYEKRLAAASSEEERFEWLGLTAFTAFQAGDLKRARELTLESLSIAEKHRDSWDYRNSIHKGHLLLGQIALDSGDIDNAAKELLAAGETPSSPQLHSFGPNMSLAKALLEHGQRDAVLRYLDKCRTFWEMGHERLDEWRAAIEQGKVPDFGANLVH